jgi:hypothetical protein
MSFVGKLDQFKLPDLLQIISGNRKTGRLNLTRRDSQGVIVFRSGNIIYAASSAARETLGSLLLCRQLIGEEDLARALELQHQASEEKRLGTILVESGMLSEEALRKVINRQIEGVIREFMQWESGFFKFDLLRLPDKGEIEVDARDFVHRDGLSAQRVLMDIATEMDRAATYPVPFPETGSGAAAAGPSPDGGSTLASLKSIMNLVRSPQFTGEATARILGFARDSLPRGALFVVRRDVFHAMSVFGGASGRAGATPQKRLDLPIDQPSIIAETADRQKSYRGPLESNEANRLLIRALGGGTPSEVVAIPLVVNDTALLVLYGDNAATGEPIEQVDQLELLMLQAGLAMERHLLRKRLQAVESGRGRTEQRSAERPPR